MNYLEDIFVAPIKIIYGMISVLAGRMGNAASIAARMVAVAFVLWILYRIIFKVIIPFITVSHADVGKRSEQSGTSSAQSRSSVSVALRTWIASNSEILAENLVLTFLMGGVIPLTILSSSPVEFASAGIRPGLLSIHAFLPYLGFFMMYMTILYIALPEKIRKIQAYAAWMFIGIAILDFVAYGWKLGILSSNFEYDTGVEYSGSAKITGLIIAAAVAAILLLIKKIKPEVVKYACLILTIVAVWMCGSDVFMMQSKLAASADSMSDKERDETITLSRDGRNVVVLMLDRAISRYVPYMFAEHPELKDQYQGFTYYNNALTFGKSTNLGSPAVFGGYEYTPLEINKRTDEKLVDKHNEALRVMPVLFSENGFDVTVADPPCGNYQWTFDVTIYDEYSDINAFNIIGQHMEESAKEFGPATEERQKHNIVCYSLMRVMPAKLQKLIYDSGDYLSTQRKITISDRFMQSYTGLTCLSSLTHIEDGNEDTFFMFQNSTTHEPVLLQRPDYYPSNEEPTGVWDDMERFTYDGVAMHMDNDAQMRHYHINMAAFLRLGEWFDYLKAQGVWDNTRIIVVSDHAYDLYQFDDMDLEKGLNFERYNPLLMVKDFDSEGDFAMDSTFMTTADVPTLAAEGLIESPVNPFTGKTISSAAKSQAPQIITTSDNWAFEGVEDNTFDISDGELWSVHDNIFDENNWEKVE